jgi:hypothetical protein
MSTSGDNGISARRERKPLPSCLTRLLRHQVAGSDHKSYVHVLAATWVQLDRLAELSGAVGAANSRYMRRR